MTISVLTAAKHLAATSGWSLSNLELQKILFLAHMFYLGRTNGEPLVSSNFEAWDYGPVNPTLYHKAKIYGSGRVQNIFHEISDLAASSEREILDEAYASLGHAGPGKLVNATHRHGGAWEQYYQPGVMHCVIPNEAILTEYRTLDGAADAA